jgi:hypothetical protein
LPFTFQWLGLHPISKVRISSNAHININADDTISHWQRAYPIVNGEVMVEPYISSKFCSTWHIFLSSVKSHFIVFHSKQQWPKPI